MPAGKLARTLGCARKYQFRQPKVFMADGTRTTPHNGGIDEYRRSQGYAQLFESDFALSGENGNHRHHYEGSSCDHADWWWLRLQLQRQREPSRVLVPRGSG